MPLFNADNAGASVNQRLRVLGGECELTGFISAFEATINMTKSFRHRWGMTEWAYLWGNYIGQPQTVAEHQSRIMMGGFKRCPGRMVGSRVTQPRNFLLGTQDTDGLNFNLSDSKGTIRWMESAKDLLVGTKLAEFAVRGSPLTPSTFGGDLQHTFGGDFDKPVSFGPRVLFPGRGGLGLREMVFRFETDGYEAPDLTDLARHLFTELLAAGTIRRQPQLIREPESLITLLEQGFINALSYRRENQIAGWSRWTLPLVSTNQEVMTSQAAVVKDTTDELWTATRRWIDGAFVDYLEIYEPTAILDSEFTVAGTPPRAAVPGYSHMEGRTLQVVADGVYIGEFTVNISGELDLSSALGADPTSVTAGLEIPVEVWVQSIPSRDGGGATEGRVRQVNEIIVRLFESVGGKVGTVPDPVGTPAGKFTPLLKHTINAAGNMTGRSVWARIGSIGITGEEGQDAIPIIKQNVPGHFEIMAVSSDVSDAE